jgi:hypothetical protein
MKFVAAVIYMCIVGTQQCQQHSIRVEPSACKIRQYQGQAPMNGEWQRVTVGVRCR